MNHFYLAKKSCFISGILNIIGSVSLILLIWLISYYHFVILKTGGNYYHLLKNKGTSGTVTMNSNLFPSAYIALYGYKEFFGAKLIGTITWWPMIRMFVVTSIFCHSLKTVLCIFNIVSAVKAKSVAFVHASLLDLFFPLIGGIMSLIVCRDNKKIIEYKATLPLQWIRFKLKNIFYQIFSDVNMKNL